MRAWEEFLSKQKLEIGDQIVNKWLVPLRVIRYDAANLYLEAEDHFQALWFEEHVRKKAEKELVNNNNRKIKIHLQIANHRTPPKKNSTRSNKKQTKSTEEQKINSYQLIFDQLDPHCSFEYFFPTDENMVPYKLLQEIIQFQTKEEQADFSEKELLTFNPIYLYGYSGTGKTHLLMATAAALIEKGINAIYTRAETFTDHVVSAIRAGEMSLFRQTYRKADVLIIDDVHIFSRKGTTQEELFHTFNALHLDGKQIILSSSYPPQELQHIEPRLISRFEWGIVLNMVPPTQEELKQILTSKTKALQFPINKKAASFFIDTFQNNSKSLTKAFEALVLRTHLDKVDASTTEITVTNIKHALKDLIEEEHKGQLTPEKILFLVAEQFGVTTNDLKGLSQKRESVLPRQISMFLCREKLKMPYMKIGSLFERDHSTVMSSIRKIDKEMQSGNNDVKNIINKIDTKLHNC